MKHVSALLIKFVMIVVILEIALGILTNLTFTDIIYVAAAVTVLAYILGDLLILSVSNNTIATFADAGLSFLAIYSFNFFWDFAEISLISALIAAASIGIGEWVFHRYVKVIVFPNREEGK